jgi:hypothetical protein
MMVYKRTVLIHTIQRKISYELGKIWKKWLWSAPKYISIYLEDNASHSSNQHLLNMEEEC